MVRPLIITALFLPQFPLPYIERGKQEHQPYTGILIKCNNLCMLNWPREIGIVVHERAYISRSLALVGFCEEHPSILMCALSESALGVSSVCLVSPLEGKLLEGR